MFNLFKTKPKGFIGYFNLNDWWQENFTDDERRHMVEKYQLIGLDKDPLVDPDFSSSRMSETIFGFLYNLASWFNTPSDRAIAKKIITKAEEYIGTEKDAFRLHFFYPTKMKIYYRERENPVALKIAIDCCIKQIELTPLSTQAWQKKYGDKLPFHEGYDQLCIIYEKQGKFEEVIQLAEQAKSQGWSGAWDSRIERAKKKIEKNKKS